MRDFVKRLGWTFVFVLGILAWACVPTPAATNTQIGLNQSRINLNVGDTYLLETKTEVLGLELVWSSSKSSVVTVDGGLVTAKRAGDAVISVSAGGETATCQVCVKRTNAKEGVYAYTYPASSSEVTSQAQDLCYVVSRQEGKLVFVLEHLGEDGALVATTRAVTVSLRGNTTGVFTWMDSLGNQGVGTALFKGTRVCLKMNTIVSGTEEWAWEDSSLVMTLTGRTLSKAEKEKLLEQGKTY